MATSRQIRESSAANIEYTPYEWIQRFGLNAEHDAQATAAIAGPTPAKRRERRNHEIQRLAQLYGKEWAYKVKDRVMEIFREQAQQ